MKSRKMDILVPICTPKKTEEGNWVRCLSCLIPNHLSVGHVTFMMIVNAEMVELCPRLL